MFAGVSAEQGSNGPDTDPRKAAFAELQNAAVEHGGIHIESLGLQHLAVAAHRPLGQQAARSRARLSEGGRKDRWEMDLPGTD